MAAHTRELRTHGIASLYGGKLGEAIVDEAQHPTTAAGDDGLPAASSTMADLAAYRALDKAPITSRYKGVDVYGMPVPSSGGIAVAEIAQPHRGVRGQDRRPGSRSLDNANYLHWFSEATATAFADRNRYVGDVPSTCPVKELTSDGVRRRAGLHSSTPPRPRPRPIPFGNPDGIVRPVPAGRRAQGQPNDGHVDDPPRHGGQVGQRRLLHADHRADRRLRDHRAGLRVPAQQRADRLQLHAAAPPGVPDPNLPGPGKRPRSSMSPTILVKDGKPYLTLGSPGGATIITSVQPDHPRLPRPRPVPRGRDRGPPSLIPERGRGGGTADL